MIDGEKANGQGRGHPRYIPLHAFSAQLLEIAVKPVSVTKLGAVEGPARDQQRPQFFPCPNGNDEPALTTVSFRRNPQRCVCKAIGKRRLRRKAAKLADLVAVDIGFIGGVRDGMDDQETQQGLVGNNHRGAIPAGPGAPPGFGESLGVEVQHLPVPVIQVGVRPARIITRPVFPDRKLHRFIQGERRLRRGLRLGHTRKDEPQHPEARQPTPAPHALHHESRKRRVSPS